MGRSVTATVIGVLLGSLVGIIGSSVYAAIMMQALVKAGLADKQYSVHTIRHSFATHLLDNGADLPTIKSLLGHANITQTMQYLHLSIEHIKEVVNPFDVLPDTAIVKPKRKWL